MLKLLIVYSYYISCVVKSKLYANENNPLYGL